MHIKRFEAATIDEALEQVRRTLGPDALILTSRTVERGRGAFGLLSRRVVEVQAALPRGMAGRESTSESTSARPVLREPIDNAVEEASDFRAMVAELRRATAVLRRREHFEEEVRSELRGLRMAFDRGRELSRRVQPDDAASLLADAGLDRRHALTLVDAWQAERASGRERSVEAFVAERIDARLAVPRFDRARRIRVLVGAPGAGKTTTLAKLAARSDEGERDVSFVSLDPFRVGARDQLRAFASLLEAPYSELSSPQGIAEIARRHPDHAILVDTAGRSPGDLARQLSLESLREGLGGEVCIEVVVDATARPEIARSQLARFGPSKPDRLILTKVDECDSLVPVLNLLLDEQCPPVCWLGTGQRVPEDLEIAEPSVFTRDLFGRAA